jgi:3'-phosphoadenosine 5'-phosphosulfate sulfotransferase (PAPS reductase)/FAD synthetase
MDLEKKVNRSREIISRVLEEFRKPAVMWSSGKDSMVMLFLLRAMGVTCPVIFHRQPWQGHRYAFRGADDPGMGS